MSERLIERLVCPECGSRRVVSDCDYLDLPPERPDIPPPEGVYTTWWVCLDCAHAWRYQNNELNPGGRLARLGLAAEQKERT